MVMKCLGSSSKGNCYLLCSAKGETLVIEAGVPFAEVKRELGFRTDGIQAVAVTHRHNDHAGHIADYMRSGIRVLAPADTLSGRDAACRAFGRAVEPLKGYRAGGFTLLPVPVRHDVPCVAYIIGHEEMGKTAFITDTMMLEYRLPAGLSHIMIEANYADDIVRGNISRGSVPSSMKQRLMHSHMELETAKDILRACDLTSVNEIVLVHLSDGNSDAGRFAREIEETTGKTAYIAAKGLVLDFDKNPY